MTTAEPDNAVLDRALNEALINADISSSYEEYLGIFDRFYAETAEVASDSTSGSVVGKDNIRPLLSRLLIPLHVLAEVGGLSVNLRYSSVQSDIKDEFHAEWMLDLEGVLGRTSSARWSSIRRWERGKVLYERHFDHQHTGAILSGADLDFGGTRRQTLEASRPS